MAIMVQKIGILCTMMSIMSLKRGVFVTQVVLPIIEVTGTNLE